MVSITSLILLLLGVFYIAGAIFEFPIMFEGNFKTKWMISKIGKKNHKRLLIVIGLGMLVLAIIVR